MAVRDMLWGMTVIIPTLSGVTTALVLFIFACLLYPQAVKNRTQFYAAFAAVVLILFMFSLDVMIRTPGFQVFAGAVTGLLQIFAFVMLFMAAGGMSAGELAGDLKRAYEVIRRGEEEKTVIVPLTGEAPKPREPQSVEATHVETTRVTPAHETPSSIPLERGESSRSSS